jgi:hypothetical protein
MYNLRKLRQMCIEDVYSKKNIHSKIYDDLNGSEILPMKKMIKALKKYIKKSYYDSKNNRLNHLKFVLEDVTYEGMIIEVMASIVSIETQTIQSVVGRIAPLLKYDDIFDGIKTAAEIVVILAQFGLYDVIRGMDSETGTMLVKSNLVLEDETLTFIANTKYLPPMICPPKRITHNMSNGYFTCNKSVILKSGNHHNKYQNLKALNIANQVSMSLDLFVLGNFKEEAKHELDTPEKVKAHNELVGSSTIVYEEILKQGNVFWFSNRYDKRGRMYCSGYHVSIQSTEYKKALINLSKKEIING